MSLRLKLLIAGVLVALAAGTVVVAREVSSILRQVQAPQVSTEPTDSPGPPGLDRFYHQRLHWNACGAAQCTWITVPVDYAHPGGKTLRLRANLIPASGSGGTRTLFVNPGGPGGSALQFAEAFAGLVGAKVRAMYDIVGVDPRGVGRSTPLKCLSDAQFDAFIDEDPTPDSPAEVRAYLRQSATLGQACRRNSGELADHVSTAEAARDMDVARALLGRSTLDWFGASYGTDLGATYATLFPERVGRMVLDGAVDPELDAFDASMAQAVGFSRALDAFIASCRGDKDCPLSRAAPIPELRRFLAVEREVEAAIKTEIVAFP